MVYTPPFFVEAAPPNPTAGASAVCENLGIPTISINRHYQTGSPSHSRGNPPTPTWTVATTLVRETIRFDSTTRGVPVALG